jgi:hypothetical protein
LAQRVVATIYAIGSINASRKRRKAALAATAKGLIGLQLLDIERNPIGPSFIRRTSEAGEIE